MGKGTHRWNFPIKLPQGSTCRFPVQTEALAQLCLSSTTRGNAVS